MPLIDRDNFNHAKKVAEYLLPKQSVREAMLEFLATAIEYAHSLDSGNWNLNLDTHGKFMRFNTGHEYCIEIDSNSSLILCNKNALKDSLRKETNNITFIGHRNGKRIYSTNIDKVPDCLSKTPDSIGCIIDNKIITRYLSLLEPSNHEFINFAVQNTTQLPQMKRAHSKGCTEYLTTILGRQIPSPDYSIDETDFLYQQQKETLRAKRLTTEQLRDKIKRSKKVADKMYVVTIQYKRNCFLTEYAKRLAKGICQDCLQPAPFISKQFKEPFLEVHHIVPLSENGEDALNNLIVLCPNCHRKRHHG